MKVLWIQIKFTASQRSLALVAADAKQQELIGRVLNAVYEAFLTEDLVTVVRKNKGCTINSKFMRKQSDLRVKDVLAKELF